MKNIFLSTLAIFVLTVSGNTQSLPGPSADNFESDPFTSYMIQADNPCNDSLYVELKNIPLDEMSDRQYEIFKQKDIACQEFMSTVEATEPAKQTAETAEKATNAMRAYYVIAGIGTLASIIFLFTL